MIELLAAAVGSEGARVSVRTAAAIAELVGPLPLRRGDEWLTIGEEGAAHLHLKTAGLASLRFAAPADANVALEVLDAAGERVCRIAFVRTNPAKQPFDAARRDELTRRFG